MRIAFITDSHFDARSRFQETIRIHDWIAQDADDRGCTLTLLGGDLFERKSVAEERNAVADWLVKLAEFGEVIGVYGNHEATGDLEIFERLSSHRRIAFHSQPVVDDANGVAVACIPWPHREMLSAALRAGSVDVDLVGREALQAVLRGLGDKWPDGLSRIALAHLQTDGCKTSTGQELIGGAISVGIADLALLDAQFYALGHIHLGPGNEWQVGEAPVVYGGSPRRCSFGEPETKSYTVIEFDGPRLVGWERVPTPCATMVLFEATWSRHGFFECNGHQLHEDDWPKLDGAEVRFRFATAADLREAAVSGAHEIAEWLKEAGAASVQLEPQTIVEASARAPEVAAAKTLDEQLEALWRARQFEPGDRRDALLQKAAQLEESHNAL